MTTLAEAVQIYTERKERATHPRGTFDKKSRWYPSDDEHQPCCDGIRSPSSHFPYSLMVHCRTIEHVANLCGVDVAELRKEVAKRNPPHREDQEFYYKQVAVVGDELQSVYIREVVYKIGEEATDRARQNHGGGFYVYRTPEEAAGAAFPDDSDNLDMPKVVIKVKVGGQYCVYDSGKIAFSRITPVEILE